MKKVIPFLFVFCMSACTDKQIVRSGLVGKWQLVESYVSIGGPGEWKIADPAKPEFVRFDERGGVEFTPKNAYSPTSYKLLTDSTLTMYRSSDEIGYRYLLKNNELTLYPPCIEGCAHRYKAVDQ